MKTRIKNLFLLTTLIPGFGLIHTGRVTAQTVKTLHYFTATSGGFFGTNSDGANPTAGLVLSGNTLYGTVYQGGTNGNGTVFAVNTNGTGFATLHSFTALSSGSNRTNSDGANPYAGLILSGNTLYGTTQYGGSFNNGTVFKVNTDGTGFTNLHSFVHSSEAAQTSGTLILSGNTLYGTTEEDGTNGHGTVFRVNTDGTSFTNLYSFTAYSGSSYGINSDGAIPYAGLILSGNTLYGTACLGGSNDSGTVFAINTDGTGFTTLYSFTGGYDGERPQAGLILSGNTLYGTTFYGGTNGYGTIFAVCTNGSGFSNLHTFTDGSDGANPTAGLILSGNTLYGTASGGGNGGYGNNGTVFALNTDGTGFTNLYSFTDGSDGANPESGLILSGNTMYGTAFGGGIFGDGTVFALPLSKQEGSLQVITTFLFNGTNGAAYSQQLNAIGGQPPYSWSLISGSLPLGLTLATNGIISGTPTTTGTFLLTVQVNDANNNTATQELSLDINVSPNVSYPVTEKWSVIVYSGPANTTQKYTGTETGTVVIANGSSYTQINHTGLALPGNLNTTMTIYYDGNSYDITGAYPFSALAGGPTGYYAVIQLSFFVILVPLGTESDIPSPQPYDSSYFTTTGTSLTSLSGAGMMVDGNTSAGEPSYYVNEVDASSTSALTLPPPDTTPPSSQITSPISGLQVSNANYTVTGTANDNVAVASVFCSVSNSAGVGPWILAHSANNWTNWNAVVTLTPGMNTVSAYAVDTSGNISTTKTVAFDYVVSAPLTVQLTGRGTITPNYSNAVLQVGTTYSMTASAVAGSGFAFTNWTGGISLPLGWLTNGTTVQFLMQSNLILQANFLDTNKPTLSITNLVSGQRVSNAEFVVMGTATDNVAVAGVYCSLSNAVGNTGFAPAMTANNWANWSTNVTLAPGTNTIRAYAVDTSGNVSTTNSISFQFVVTNQLQIRAIGLGTISPNYSNAWLNIGQNYSITSAPASGFVFTNWIISTNWIGGTTVTSTNLQFMMESNLTLQAIFAETSNPILLITAPTAGQHMTNALATVTGTTSDKWGVSGVWYQLNNGAWNASATTNGWTNWTTTVELITGTNTVKAYAMNLGGNVSTNSSVSMVSSNTFMLQLAFTNAVPLKTIGLVLTLQLSTGLNGHIQVSTNLTSWTTLTNFVGTNSTLIFHDSAATNYSRRFYQAVIP